MPVRHRLGGVLPQRTRIGKLQMTGAENTREGARDSLARLVREKTRQASEKDKESQVRNVNGFNKTSNGNNQANYRKQMKKPRPTHILVFDVFSPARS